MSQATLRKVLIAFLILLVPIEWIATRYAPYEVDGDGVNYMDIASYLHAHVWHAAVNSYWHPLYPAFLALGQVVFHPTRANELGVYYAVNFSIFLLEAIAVLAFVSALTRLRTRMASGNADVLDGPPLLSADALKLLGLGLLVIAAQRELPTGKIGPDALLQALMLGGFAALLATLATESWIFAPIAGVLFGLAFLTKSFALAVAVLAILVTLAFGLWAQRRTLRWAIVSGTLAIVPFALIAAPYISAMSHKFHRLDIGDSGSLNYAWYSGDTEKMHLEPSMTSEFGTATVHLEHPEQQLLSTPGIYSYRAVPFGTNPDWFDTAWFNAGVKPHIKLGPLVTRDKRNLVLVVRYIFNHPEAVILLLLALAIGARLSTRGFPRTAFWLPMLALGLAIWAVYGLVNIEERYVTLGWLMIMLPLFAMLRVPEDNGRRAAITALVAALAFLALCESLRLALDHRRYLNGTPAWRKSAIFDTADALTQLGVHPGDNIACMGSEACLNDYYWARLAGVRITEEIYAPDKDNLLQAWEDLSTRNAALNTLKQTDDKVLVAWFNPLTPAREPAATEGWRPLGNTGFWALPLTLNAPPPTPVPPQPWVAHAQGNQ